MTGHGFCSRRVTNALPLHFSRTDGRPFTHLGRRRLASEWLDRRFYDQHGRLTELLVLTGSGRSALNTRNPEADATEFM